MHHGDTLTAEHGIAFAACFSDREQDHTMLTTPLHDGRRIIAFNAPVLVTSLEGLDIPRVLS